jgi:hypothetical protein
MPLQCANSENRCFGPSMLVRTDWIHGSTIRTRDTIFLGSVVHFENWLPFLNPFECQMRRRRLATVEVTREENL